MAELPTEPGPGQWLSQSEAADRLGWRLERVRSAARRGKLQRRKDNRGEWLVFVPDDLAARAALAEDQGDSSANDRGGSVGGQVSGSASDQGMARLVVELRAELAEVRADLSRAAERAARGEGELAARDVLLATKDALVAELRTALDHERQEKAHLRAELAEARRPWVVRVLEGLRRRP